MPRPENCPPAHCIRVATAAQHRLTSNSCSKNKSSSRSPCAFQHLDAEIGLKIRPSRSGYDVQLDRDQRPVSHQENRLRLGRCALSFVATGSSVLGVNRHQLRILGERIVDLSVARHDLRRQVSQIDSRSPPFWFHPRTPDLKRIGER